MKISLDNIGKKFNRRWIFKEIKFDFEPHGKYALLGANGSGKSTLLQILAAHQSATKGAIQYHLEGEKIAVENVFKHLSLAAPSMDLPEELSYREILEFHSKFKQPIIPIKEIISLTNLTKDAEKQIRYFSSGMRQRAMLALAILFESGMVLLDEPTSHLDKNGVQWYKDILKQYLGERLLIIASNDPDEYEMCNTFLKIEDWKGKS